MKYLKQFAVILTISLLGELLHFLLLLPVPASIYGLVLMLASLKTRLVKPEQVRETGMFLVDILAVLFVPPAVRLLTVWDVLRPVAPAYAAITLVSTVFVMAAAGRVTQWAIRKKGGAS